MNVVRKSHLEEAAVMSCTESFYTVKPVILTCMFYYEHYVGLRNNRRGIILHVH